MKGIRELLKGASSEFKPPEPPAGKETVSESLMFASAFADQGLDPSMLVPWEARAVEVGATHLPADRGIQLLQALWAKDKFMSRLDTASVQRLGKFFQFATVAGDRDIIRQDEYGNFMVVLLTGSIAVDRLQPWGEQLRLNEARPGDILGEMSLLDSGMRFSVCTSLAECELAILSAEAMDDMMVSDSRLAATLIALLARRLSMRMRVVSARLTKHRT